MDEDEKVFGKKQKNRDVSELLKHVQSLKGDKGEPGPKGEEGKIGPPGHIGPRGPRGERGFEGPQGPQGPQGKPGIDGLDGKDGKDGKDGSDDTPEQIVIKVNKSKEKIEASQIKNLRQEIPEISIGKGGGGGGSLPLKIRDEGLSLGEDVQTLDFVGDGVSATRVGQGYIVVSISGGSSLNFAENETPSGTFNGSNDTFTLANAPEPSDSLRLYLNGQFLTQGVDYTLSGVTITFDSAPSASYSGLPFKAFYRY